MKDVNPAAVTGISCLLGVLLKQTGNFVVKAEKLVVVTSCLVIGVWEGTWASCVSDMERAAG